MNTAFAIFDTERRLVAWSDRADKVLNFPEGSLRRGDEHGSFIQRLQAHFAAPPIAADGSIDIGEQPTSPEEYGEQLLNNEEDRTWHLSMHDGRFLEYRHSPLSEGGFALTITDITDQKITEIAEARARDRLSDAVDNIQEGLALFDEDDRLLLVNAAFMAMFPKVSDAWVPGNSFDDLAKAYFHAGYAALDAGDEDEWLKAVRARRENLPLRHELATRDGRWILIGENRTAEGGTVRTWTDVTELKTAQQQAQAARARLVDAIESLDEGFIQYDGNDRLVEINQRVLDLVPGLADILVIGRTSDEVFSSLSDSGLILAAIGREDQWYRERRERHAAPNQAFDILFSNGTILRAQERPTSEGGTVTTALDVTNERRAEELARQRLAEMAHVQRQSAISQLSSAIAHELNQPLTAAMNFVEASRGNLRHMRHDPEKEAAVEGYLGNAGEQIERAAAIIRNLRKLLESGDGEFELHDANALIKEVCTLALIGAKSSDVRVQFSLDSELPAVLVDKVQFQQVLINLIRNALDAMENKAQASLRIETEFWGETVRICVTDNGVGIPEAMKKDLFQPFQSSKVDSPGLGLWICKTIVEAHGGRIEAESIAGEGSTMSITIPIASELERMEEKRV